MHFPSPPKPRPKRRSFTIFIFVGVAGFILIAGGIFAVRSLIGSGITKGPDNMFGDQHLKTAVAILSTPSRGQSVKDTRVTHRVTQSIAAMAKLACSSAVVALKAILFLRFYSYRQEVYRRLYRVPGLVLLLWPVVP